jgi:lysophospholipase L1-like esterase
VKWRRYLVVVSVSSIVLWLALEIVLRFFGYGDYIIYTTDPDLIWVPRPNQVGKTVAGHKTETINEQGLRYPSDLGNSSPGEHRVFVFGDSVTMGWGQDDDSHFSAVLERMLNSEFPERHYRVVSAGVNAYPTLLCVRRFVKLLDQGVQIDTAVLAYSFNTEYEALANLDEDQLKGLQRKVQLKSVLRRSAVYNLVIEDWLRNAVYYRLRGRLMEGSWETQRVDPSDRLEGYVASLEAMRLASQSHGVRLVFLLLGSQGQRMNALSENQAAFLEFAQRNRIPLVNMIKRFESLDQHGLYVDHVHPNSKGHALIAEALAKVLRDSTQQGYVVTGPP